MRQNRGKIGNSCSRRMEGHSRVYKNLTPFAFFGKGSIYLKHQQKKSLSLPPLFTLHGADPRSLSKLQLPPPSIGRSASYPAPRFFDHHQASSINRLFPIVSLYTWVCSQLDVNGRPCLFLCFCLFFSIFVSSELLIC